MMVGVNVDLLMNFLVHNNYYVYFLYPEMFIGFTQRSQTVSESYIPPGFAGFVPRIQINSTGSERRDYSVRIRVTTSNATVEGFNIQYDTSYDAVFGRRNEADDQISENITITKGTFKSKLLAIIVPDFLPEGLECFTLKITGLDYEGFRDISSCNEDDTHPTNYFCEHTICIEDDDG